MIMAIKTQEELEAAWKQACLDWKTAQIIALMAHDAERMAWQRTQDAFEEMHNASTGKN